MSITLEIITRNVNSPSINLRVTHVNLLSKMQHATAAEHIQHSDIRKKNQSWVENEKRTKDIMEVTWSALRLEVIRRVQML